jgi:dTDP-4-amino-4,6-dideoxygalactose transaminase
VTPIPPAAPTTAHFNVPAYDPLGSYRTRRDDILRAVAAALDGGEYILGSRVRGFERAFASYCERDHAIGVNSCTDALTMSLTALGVGTQDEVVTSPVTFVATAAAIARTGATPVFADIDPRTFTLDPESVAAAVTPRTRAILPVHLYGHPADMAAIANIAGRVGAWVIADAAQAVGARYRGRPVGAYGDAVAYSFFPTKVLGAAGDGGAVVADDIDLLRQVLALREHGLQGDVSVRLGLNSRLDAVQAAILSVKLTYVEDEIARRRAVAGRYDEFLSGSPVTTPLVADGCEHAYYQYTVLVPGDRDGAVSLLRDNGVDARVYYAVPLHRHPSLAPLVRTPQAMSGVAAHAATAISLPCHPCVTPKQQEQVAEVLLRRYGCTG